MKTRIWIDDELALEAVIPLDQHAPYEPVRSTLDIDGTLYGLELGYSSFKDNAIRLWRDGEVIYRSHAGGFSNGGRIGRLLSKESSRRASMRDSAAGGSLDVDSAGSDGDADGWSSIVGIAAGFAIAIFDLGGSYSTLLAIVAALALPALIKSALKFANR